MKAVSFIGAEVGAGDILIGKSHAKAESPMTPEEKLLRAILVKKATDVKDEKFASSSGNARNSC